MFSKLFITPAKNIFGFLSSLKTAIPLLVVTIIVTIAGSLFPQPDLFKTWWYLTLLGLNGVSLLFITILHIPMILERKGRNALIGVVVTHLGILILIAGVIYGGMSGFRYEVKAIEDEMTIVPGLPFVIHLDKLVIEEYPEDMIVNMNPGSVLRKRQDSYLSLIRNGEQWLDFVTRPGTPAKVDGITILPAINDTGLYFELIITDPRGTEKTIPVRPWAPPIFSVGETPMMAHSLMDTGELTAQVFTMVDEKMIPLGVVSREQALEINGSSVSLGNVKRYTGLFIYNRPHAPVLVIGCLAMLFGLIWHFYFRHRDRG
jgi:cytochrome c biogenesis protein ResB